MLYRVDRMAVVDLKGQILASTGEHDLLSAWPDLSGIQAAVNAGGSSTDASVSPDGETRLHLYHTVAGDEGEPIAAVVIDIRPPDLFELLRRVTDRLGASGEVVLVNRDRQILSPLKFPLEDGTRPGPLEYRIEAMPAASAAKGLEGIVETLDYRGEPVVAAYRYISVGADIGWGMVVKRDSKEVFAPVRREVRDALALGLLAVIPMIGLVLGVARRLTRPLAELSQAARRVSEGDLSARAPVGPADEVGMLAATFNSMVERVQLRRRELEQQVAGRTAELRRSQRELTVQNRIADVFLTVSDDNMYADVLAIVLDALDSKHGAFGYINEEGACACPAVTPDFWDPCQMPDKEMLFSGETWAGVWGRCAAEGVTVWENKPLSVPSERLTISNVLCVPILHQGETIGNFQVANKDGGYQQEDRRLLEAIARRTAPVLEARLERDKQESARKNAEQALQDAHAELERRVQERTAELQGANERLQSEAEDRTQAERALRESHGTLRAIIEGTTDVVFLKDSQGRYMIANTACARFLGSSQEEILGRDDRDFFPPDTAERLAADDRRIMALGEPEIVEETIETSDGGTGTYSVLKAPFRGEGGAIIGVLGIARDVSERRRLEEEVARARHLEALGTLAGGIAHDFNNYLTGLRGAIALARSRVDPQDQAYEVLSYAEKESLRASGLAEQLLTFARGGAPIRKMASLGEIIRDTVTFALSGSNVRAEMAIPSDLWSAEVDEGQISQVISNVVRNAAEAMTDGGVVTVSVENVIVTAADLLPLQNGRYAKLSIKDHGRGMPAETQRRALDPYFTTKQNGSGLGLAVASSIVSKHGGHIAIESQTGVGTIVSVYLPSSNEGAPAQVDEKVKPNVTRGRILFVDDEVLIRMTHAAILGNLGYKVDCASDGKEAVARYRDAKDSGEPFDAVIMDLTLPGGLGGKEATRQLLDIDREARVIASSGYSNDPVMANFAEHGFKAVVPKPYSTEELTSALAAVIGDEDTRDG